MTDTTLRVNGSTYEVERFDQNTSRWVPETTQTPTIASARVGLYDPSPAVQRMIGLPTVMSSPPTVTTGSSGGASTIASTVYTSSTQLVSGTWIMRPSVPWRYYGGQIAVASQAANSQETVSAFNVNGAVGGNYAVEFEFDGIQFEFRTRGVSGAASYRILVDGQYVALAPTISPPGDGQLYRQLVVFAARANRRIRIEFSGTTGFGGLNVGPNDTIWAPSSPVGPRVVVFGDSITSGTGATALLSGYPDMMAKLLGWRDVYVSGIGGTGYLAPNTTVKFRDRVVTDVITPAPDVVVIAGGINDVGVYTAAAIGAEASLLYAQIRAGLPNVKLIVVGPWSPTGSPSANTIAVRDALAVATAADTGPHLFIDNVVATAAGASTLGWLTGTGKVGTTTGSGNADLYTSADGTHPSQAGADYLGRRMATAIAAGMPL